jgi:hypothetical protein
MASSRMENGDLPAHALGLFSHGSPVLSRFTEHSFSFKVLSVVRQLVALSGPGTKPFCLLTGFHSVMSNYVTPRDGQRSK